MPLQSPRPRTTLHAAFAAVALCAATGAFAQARDMGIYGQVGSGDYRTRSATVGFTQSLRSADAVANSPWDFIGQFEVGEWYVQRQADGQRKFFTQIGFTPVLRYTFGGGGVKGVFVEIGVGVNWITPHFQAGDERFSTAFNFGDHLGVGGRFGAKGEHEVSLRFQHFSNAGIKNPNPGIDFAQVRYAWHF